MLKRKSETLDSNGNDKPPSKKKCLAHNLQDLIDIANSGLIYKNIDMHLLWRILPSLNELNGMIGMEKLKKSVFYQILYYIQRLNNRNTDYMNTVIYGEPGCGKTTVAKILGQLYNDMGILPSNKFVSAKKDDFVGRYLGHTADKTRKFLEGCLGGVLFIDEAYSFSSGKKDHDSFAKEALDMLNSFLSENKSDICCIIAGYEEDVRKCFFNINKGLESRFQWIHTIEKYTSKELSNIFIDNIYKYRWKISFSTNDIETIIKSDYDNFKNSGRDMEKLFTFTKLCHSKRIFGLERNSRYKITLEDLQKGVKMFKTHKQKDLNDSLPPLGMYT